MDSNTGWTDVVAFANNSYYPDLNRGAGGDTLKMHYYTPCVAVNSDALRWAWLEEKTLFRYFEAENVFAYWLESQMLHRWDILNKEEGTRIFRELIADMKRDIHFDKSKL